MSPRFTLWLLLANLAVFGTIAVLHVRSAQAAARAIEQRRIVPPAYLQPDRITLDGPGVAQPWTLERRGTEWWLASPYEWPANPFAVRRLLSLLAVPNARTTFTVDGSPASLAGYNLAEPPATLTLHAPGGGEAIALRFGQPDGPNAPIYLLSAGGNRVHVMSTEMLAGLLTPVSDLRARDVIRIEPFEARALAVQLPTASGLRVRLARGNTSWDFETPIQARASAEAVEALLGRLRRLETSRFLGPPVTGDNAAAQPDFSDALRVTLEGNARRQTLLVGPPAPGDAEGVRTRFARLEDRTPVFTIDARIANDLADLVGLLRDRTLVPTPPADARSISIGAPGRPAVALQRGEGGGWQVVGRGADGTRVRADPAEPAVVDALLATLAAARIDRFVTDTPSTAEVEEFRLTSPEREVTLAFPTGSPPLTLAVGARDARTSLWYVRRSPEAYVYATSTDLAALTPPDPLHYRARLVHAFPAEVALLGISVTDAATSSEVRSWRPPEGTDWTAYAASLAAHEAAALPTALAGLRELRAARLLADGTEPPRDRRGDVRPWRWSITLRLAAPGNASGPSTVDLLVAPAVGDEPLVLAAPTPGLTFIPQPALASALAVLLPE